MDDIEEDYLPQNCIILSPEDLAKLGVKLQNAPPSTSENGESNSKYAKHQMEESVGMARNTREQTNFASCSKTAKVMTNKISTESKNLDKQKSISVSNPTMENRNDRNAINNSSIRYKETGNKTKDYSESPSLTKKQIKTPQEFVDKSAPCSDLINLQSPVPKRRGRPKKSLPLVIYGNSVVGDANTIKLPFNHGLDVKNALKCDKSKNEEVGTSKPLPKLFNTNSHSSPDASKEFSLMDDANSKLGIAPDSSSSKVSIKTSDTRVQKPKRGRPKKYQTVDGGNLSLLNAHFENISANSFKLTLNKPEDVSIGSDKSFKETSEVLEDNKSRKGRKVRIKNYKVLDSDVGSNNDRNHESDSDASVKVKTKKRRKRVSRRISDSETSLDNDPNSSSDEFIPKQKVAKIEAREADSNSNFPIVNDINISLEMGDKTICEENQIPKKRGRPKKNSLEPNKIVSCPPIPVNELSELDNSVITTSKRGRKTREVNYSLLDNPDIYEYDPKGRGRNKTFCLEQHIEQSTNFPSPETENEEENNELSSGHIEEVHENSNETTEDNSSIIGKTSRYKWTGNVTKAINQMFSAIKNDSITDSGHNPLLGKTKRKGRGKDNVDYLLDKDGSSVCMVCNETVPNTQWPKHKKTVHYNLTWRKGDLSLNVTNEDFVLRTLKELIGERGFLKCNQCSEKITNAKKFATHIEICNGVVNSSGYVTCAVCKTAMEKGAWPYHNYRQHNNLAWREGDPPLNLEDQDLVLRILNALYKARKPLHCEKCGQQKKSVLGFLSHKSTCQKTGEELENMKVSCKLCGRKILPVSMDYHLKNHEEKKAQLELINSDYFNVDVGIRGKRKAATQALEVINSIKGHAVEESKYYIYQCDFQESFVSDILRKTMCQQSPIQCIFTDCDFDAEVVEDMIHHMNSCDKKPDQYFICKICLSWCKEEFGIQEHVKAEHNKTFKANQDMEFQSEGEQNDSEDDEILDDQERERKRLRFLGKQKMLNQPNVRVKPMFLVHSFRQTSTSILYRRAYSWMLEFCEINYKLNLYQYLRNDRPWQVLDCDILSNYLPENTQSCDIAAKVITVEENPPDPNELNFRKLDLFEVGALYEDDITIYCGGPISAVAWLPTPYNQKTYNQILAVAVFNTMKSYYTVDKNFHEPCIIQFWDFGILDFREKNVSKPSLLFGMAVTCGPIWHLEWCPSGCLDCFREDTTSRLGLLAVAASDSYAYIYSIDNLPDANDRGFIYKGEPVLKLQLESEKNTLEGQSYYPTRISWSKADGHRYMAVGYSTGLVALYDLQNESLLLQRGDNTGTNIVFPYKSFQAHYSSITALTLSHLSGGNKFLFSASFDRTSLYWDLRTMSKIAPCKRNTIADGVWMTQWPTYLVTDDESTFNERARAHSYYKALRYLMSPDTPYFTFAMSGIKTLSYSDWLNTILHGSNAGEVMAQFTHRMFCNLETRLLKTSYARCIFSVTKLVKKDSSINDMAITYDEAAKKYKVTFLDYNLNNIEKTPNSYASNKLGDDNLSSCDLREYSLQSINKIAFNPNPQACSFYAIGYQAGFVRLQWIEFVSPLLQQYQSLFNTYR